MAKIRTKVSSEKYRENWDKIFNKGDKNDKEKINKKAGEKIAEEIKKGNS